MSVYGSTIWLNRAKDLVDDQHEGRHELDIALEKKMVLKLDDTDIEKIAQSVFEKIRSSGDSRSDYISVSKAAEYLGGISPKTLYSWINGGKLKAYSPEGENSRKLLRVSELDHFVAASG